MSRASSDWTAISFDMVCAVEDAGLPYPSKEILDDFVTRYPDWREDLVDFATTWVLMALLEDGQGSPDAAARAEQDAIVDQINRLI